MDRSAGELVKLRLRAADGEVETPWAEVVAPLRLRLDNVPFFAYGISLDDVVEAVPTEYDGVFEFVRVVATSGNSTVRIAFLDFPSTDTRAQAILGQLLALGCSYEGMSPRLDLARGLSVHTRRAPPAGVRADSATVAPGGADGEGLPSPSNRT